MRSAQTHADIPYGEREFVCVCGGGEGPEGEGGERESEKLSLSSSFSLSIRIFNEGGGYNTQVAAALAALSCARI